MSVGVDDAEKVCGGEWKALKLGIRAAQYCKYNKVQYTITYYNIVFLRIFQRGTLKNSIIFTLISWTVPPANLIDSDSL